MVDVGPLARADRARHRHYGRARQAVPGGSKASDHPASARSPPVTAATYAGYSQRPVDAEELIRQTSESVRSALDAAQRRADEIVREAEAGGTADPRQGRGGGAGAPRPGPGGARKAGGGTGCEDPRPRLESRLASADPEPQAPEPEAGASERSQGCPSHSRRLPSRRHREGLDGRADRAAEGGWPDREAGGSKPAPSPGRGGQRRCRRGAPGGDEAGPRRHLAREGARGSSPRTTRSPRPRLAAGRGLTPRLGEVAGPSADRRAA